MYTRCKIRVFNFLDPPEWQRTIIIIHVRWQRSPLWAFARPPCPPPVLFSSKKTTFSLSKILLFLESNLFFRSKFAFNDYISRFLNHAVSKYKAILELKNSIVVHVWFFASPYLYRNPTKFANLLQCNNFLLATELIIFFYHILYCCKEYDLGMNREYTLVCCTVGSQEKFEKVPINLHSSVCFLNLPFQRTANQNNSEVQPRLRKVNVILIS